METYRSGLAQFYYVWDVLTGFYSPTTVKRKNWEKAKSIRSEMDKTVNGGLRHIRMSCIWTVDPSDE